MAAATAGTTVAAVTMLGLGVVGLVGLLGVGGVVGSRFAAADEAEERALRSRPAAPCTAGEPEPCAETASTCAGSCALCPRADGRVTSPRCPDRP